MVVTLFIGTMLLGISTIYTPWMTRRQELERQYSEELQRGSVIANIKNIEEQLAQQEKKLILKDGDTPLLTREITRMASRAGVEVISVLPQNELRIGNYVKLQIRLDAAAGYADLVRLIHAIERYEPILQIDQLEMGNPPQMTQSDVYRRVDTSATSIQVEAGQGRQKIKLLISAFALGSTKS
ncbi:MAG: type II secretion system protein M [Candidatus Omnitrophica bacterium]|nr:type II secretion system protein M [Candidatus Omnitrophota bacterium]